MAKIHRDFDIIAGLNRVEYELEGLLKIAGKLDREVEEIHLWLRDTVDKKDIDALRKLVFAISDSAEFGIARIRELEEKMYKQDILWQEDIKWT